MNNVQLTSALVKESSQPEATNLEKIAKFKARISELF